MPKKLNFVDILLVIFYMFMSDGQVSTDILQFILQAQVVQKVDNATRLGRGVQSPIKLTQD